MRITSVLEYSSRELLDLSRHDTPERYKRRLEIGPTKVIDSSIDYDTGNAIIRLITHDHEQELQVQDFVGLVAEEILTKYKDGIPRTQLVRVVKVAMRLLLEHGDILVDCACPDYKYRFNWLAKNYGFALRDRIVGYDYPPDKANPRKIGGICKHITKCLSRQTQWSDQASRKLINQLLEHDKFMATVILPDKVDDEVLFEEDYEDIANGKVVDPNDFDKNKDRWVGDDGNVDEQDLPDDMLSEDDANFDDDNYIDQPEPEDFDEDDMEIEAPDTVDDIEPDDYDDYVIGDEEEEE